MKFKPVPRKTNPSKMDFEGLIAKGEMAGPSGFKSQTVNGTAHWSGSGWNRDYDWGPKEQVEATGPWSGARTNRTGE